MENETEKQTAEDQIPAAETENEASFTALSEQVNALAEENARLRSTLEALQRLPQFCVKSKSEKDSFSAIREAFRKK